MKQINIKMNIIYPFKSQQKLRFNRRYIRILPKFKISKKDLNQGESVVTCDPTISESVIASKAGSITKLEGKLYEKLLKLNLPLDSNYQLTKNDKEKIIQFVSDYSQPTNPKQYVHELTRDVENPLKPFFSDGDEIDWIFFKFRSNPLEKQNYFEFFQLIYLDFVSVFQIIKNRQYDQLNTYQETFNNNLKDNFLYLPSNNQGFRTTWLSNTSLGLCYLELYELIMSNMSIKTCKYCGNTFESAKSNNVNCSDCRNPKNYRKLYYQKNLDKEREKARSRMKKRGILNALIKKHVHKNNLLGLKEAG